MKQHPSDAALVRRCLRGDTRAFGTLVDRYQKVLYNVALRIVKDPDDAADIAQAVFVRAWENLKQYDPEYKFFSWIYRMTVNRSLNAAERQRRMNQIDGTDIQLKADQVDDVVAAETQEQIDEAILRLVPEDRALISLKYTAELSYRDMAFIFDINEKTVKSRLYTARQRLKDHLIAVGING